MGLFRKCKIRTIANFHETDLVTCGNSREGNRLSYSRINTVFILMTPSKIGAYSLRTDFAPGIFISIKKEERKNMVELLSLKVCVSLFRSSTVQSILFHSDMIS